MKKSIKNILASILILFCLSIIFNFKTPANLDTLFGVLIGGLISFLTLRENLNHTSSENKITRLIEMKKSIYFEALESVAKMRIILSSITTINLDTSSIDVNIINGLQKVNLIAGIELIKKLTLCTNYFQEAFQDMVYDKIIINTMQGNAEYAIETNSHYLKMAGLNPNEFETLIEKSKKCLLYHDRIIKEILEKKIELIKKSQEHSCKFSSLLADCLPNLREDLENGFTETEKEFYKKMTEESSEKALQSGMDFLKNFQNIKKFDLPCL